MSERIIIQLGDHITALVVPEIEDDDVWKAIEEYDAAHGTDLWDMLDESKVLGVDLPEYNHVPEVEVVETRVTGARARRIVEDARNAEQWDSDGEDGSRWYAVQNGITDDGWPFTVRYAFPLGFEPEGDEDYWTHIEAVTVVGPAVSKERIRELDERMPDLIMRFGLSPREAQAVILSDMGKGPQEIADILGEMLGISMTRQSITNALRKARIKMAIDQD